MQQNLLSKEALFPVAHIAVWAGVTVAVAASLGNFLPANLAWQRAVFIVGLNAAVFYVHAGVLVNKLLERKKILLYAVCLAALVAVALTIRIVVNELWVAIALPVNVARVAPSKTGLVVLPTLLAILFSTLYQLLYNYYKRERQYLIRINELSKAELVFLKNQINPHFLFNHLNNIYSLVVTGAPAAGDAVLQLSEVLRYVIYKSGAEKVSLAEECEQIDNLIALFRLKDDAQHITFDMEGQKANVWIEPMLLIPIVENCFKHCDDLSQAGSYVNINVVTDEQWLACSTANTTMAEGRPSTDKGVGLANIKRRLENVYGADNYRLHCWREHNIFYTKLEIRWRQSFPA